MELSHFFHEMNYRYLSPRVYELIQSIELFNFHRERDGRFQNFYFYFWKDGNTHILKHRFLYHNTGVDNWFSFVKPFFSSKPFRLSHYETEQLSNALMKAVNNWNAYKRNINIS